MRLLIKILGNVVMVAAAPVLLMGFFIFWPVIFLGLALTHWVKSAPEDVKLGSQVAENHA